MLRLGRDGQSVPEVLAAKVERRRGLQRLGRREPDGRRTAAPARDHLLGVAASTATRQFVRVGAGQGWAPHTRNVEPLDPPRTYNAVPVMIREMDPEHLERLQAEHVRLKTTNPYITMLGGGPLDPPDVSKEFVDRLGVLTPTQRRLALARASVQPWRYDPNGPPACYRRDLESVGRLAGGRGMLRTWASHICAFGRSAKTTRLRRLPLTRPWSRTASISSWATRPATRGRRSWIASPNNAEEKTFRLGEYPRSSYWHSSDQIWLVGPPFGWS